MGHSGSNSRRGLALGLLLGTAASPGMAGDPANPGIYFVPNVVSQFNAVARRGDGLAFNISGVPDDIPFTLCRHAQGLARVPGPGRPFLIVSFSGNDPGFLKCPQDTADNEPGSLLVVRMDSRDTSGERLRSNRLRRDWPAPLVLDPLGLSPPLRWTRPPDPRDRVTAWARYDGGAFPDYAHPGGMQIVDDVLAVAVEKSYAPSVDNIVTFVDVRNPEQPALLSQFPRAGSSYDMGPAGLVGMTPVRNPEGGLNYIMVSTGGDNSVVRLWRSKATPGAARASTNLRSADLDWELVDRFTVDEFEASGCRGGIDDWPEGRDGFQSLNFVREGDLDGTLYVIGTRNTGVGGIGRDMAALYRVNVDAYGNPLSRCLFEGVRERQLSSFPYGGHGDSAALSAAGGAYVSPSGELILYGTEYENDGPWELLPDGTRGPRTVRFVEWRHINVVRGDSPTLRPSVQLPAIAPTVDEGSSVQLSGVGRPPVTRAWIALFEDDNAGRELPAWYDGDDWLQIDYDDRAADHFEDFRRLDATALTGFDDQAGSWRWFAPEGCTLRANQDPLGATTGVFPGRLTRTLPGDGNVYVANDLDAVLNDARDGTLDDTLSGVQFDALPGTAWDHPSCDAYYAAPIAVRWDLDGDAVFETAGSAPTFSAALLDGPTRATVHALAQHPTDGTPLGTSDAISIAVAVRNVAPAIAGVEIRDAMNNVVGTTVPFVLQGLPLTLRATFTDPGRADRQTATVAWGDGTTDPNTAFASYVDAFGGASGSLLQDHTYWVSGARAVQVTVTDDDGGAGSATRAVRVLTPAEAIAEIGALLNALIAATPEGAARLDLIAARRALLGSPPPTSENGALDRLAAGVYPAAQFLLRMAAARLDEAAAAGVDASALASLVRQVALAMPSG